MIARIKPKSKALTINLVRVTYIPNQLFKVLKAGPQQTELQWVGSNQRSIVCNEFIEDVDP
jgi:hypothetical protein